MNLILTTEQVLLLGANGKQLSIAITNESGRIVYRNKIDTLLGVPHPGIIIGRDQNRNRWILHHHYANGKPSIEIESKFCSGNLLILDKRPVFYNRIDILERALQAWNSGIKYHWLLQNCQHFVNKITRNQHRSESVEKISERTMMIGGVSMFLGALAGNKTLFNSGMAILGTGAIGKVLSQ